MRLRLIQLLVVGALFFLFPHSDSTAKAEECHCAACDLTVECTGTFCGCALTCSMNPDGTCSFRVWCFSCPESAAPQVASGRLENVPLGEAVALIVGRSRLNVRITGDPSQRVSICV